MVMILDAAPSFAWVMEKIELIAAGRQGLGRSSPAPLD